MPYDNIDSHGVWRNSIDEDIVEVLAPVPSYEEWQAKLEENKRLKHDVGNLGYKIKNQRKEIERQIAQNAKLKELLKEIRQQITTQVFGSPRLQLLIINCSIK